MSSGHWGHHVPEPSRLKPEVYGDRDEQRLLMNPRRSPSPQRFLGKRILQETSQTVNVAKLPGSLEKLQSSITKRLQAQPSREGQWLQYPEPFESPVFQDIPSSLSRKLRLQALDEPRHPQIDQLNRSPSPDENYLSDIWKASSSTSSLAITLPPLPLELLGREVLEADFNAAGGVLIDLVPRLPLVPGLQVNPVAFQTPRPTTAQENQSRYSEQTHQEALRRYDMQVARYRDAITPITKVRRVNNENEVKVSEFLPMGKVADELMLVLEENKGSFVCPAYPLLNKPDGWNAYKQMAKSVKQNPSIVEPLHNAQARLHLGDDIYRRMDKQHSGAQMQRSSTIGEGAASRDSDPSNQQDYGLSAGRSESSLLQRRLSVINMGFMTTEVI